MGEVMVVVIIITTIKNGNNVRHFDSTAKNLIRLD